MSKKGINYLSITLLIVSSLLLLMGGIMLVKNLSAYGVNRRTLMVSGYGGHLLILFGIISFIVTYYSLSPFSKIRNMDFKFFNRKKKK